MKGARSQRQGPNKLAGHGLRKVRRQDLCKRRALCGRGRRAGGANPRGRPTAKAAVDFEAVPNQLAAISRRGRRRQRNLCAQAPVPVPGLSSGGTLQGGQTVQAAGLERGGDRSAQQHDPLHLQRRGAVGSAQPAGNGQVGPAADCGQVKYRNIRLRQE
jgi:hypothetical protein